VTKLNHERWELRLADNLRREGQRVQSFPEESCSLNTVEWHGFEFGETRALRTVLEYFNFLEPDQRATALDAITAFKGLKTAKRREVTSSHNTAPSDMLDDAAERLFDSVAHDLDSHSVGFWDWYLYFLDQLPPKEYRAWETFTYAIMKRRLKPWLARHSAKWPPHVALFRDNLTKYRL
jgi:hypothetical protein